MSATPLTPGDAMFEPLAPLPGSGRAMTAAVITVIGWFAASLVFGWLWLEVSISKLCFSTSSTDAPCREWGDPHWLLTAGRWTSWLAGAALAVAAFVLAGRTRRGRGSVRAVWMAIAATLIAAAVFAVLLLSGPVAPPL